MIKNEDVVEDDSLTLFLNLLNNIGCKKVDLVGLDGFRNDVTLNFADDKLILSQNFNPEEYNARMKNMISRFKTTIDISFLTKSLYD